MWDEGTGVVLQGPNLWPPQDVGWALHYNLQSHDEVQAASGPCTVDTTDARIRGPSPAASDRKDLGWTEG